MIKRVLFIAALCIVSTFAATSQTPNSEETTIFVRWESLDVSTYSSLKSAFDSDSRVDLTSICLAGDLLCISGEASQTEIWQFTKELLETSFPESSPTWESQMTREEYLEISRSFRTQAISNQ